MDPTFCRMCQKYCAVEHNMVLGRFTYSIVRKIMKDMQIFQWPLTFTNTY